MAAMATQMRHFGLMSAMAQKTDENTSAVPSDYRALVCIFMFGGNDSNNMVLATDNDSWGRYFATRNTGSAPIALMPAGTPPTAVGAVSSVTGRTVSGYDLPEAWGGVLPITPSTPNPVPPGTNASVRTFALNPHMAPLQQLWQSGRLAVAANVGPLIVPTAKAQYVNHTVKLPANLQSHNDQQSTWQSGSSEGATKGWGGLMADQIVAANGANGVFTAISTAGTAVFLSGQSVVQYQISTNQTSPAIRIGSAASATSSLFGASGGGARVREIIRDTGPTSYFGKDYDAKVVRSMDTADLLNTTFASATLTAVAAPTQLVNPITPTAAPQTNPLAVQLQSVAKIIAANQTLGIKRQVFFVSIGGFDTHSGQNASHAPLMARLAHALAYFDEKLSNLGGVDMRPQVTTFTASDFSRAFTANGDGTDHAWGAHHFVMGGSVRGGNMYGQYPTLGPDLGSFVNPNMAGGTFIPTMAVDQYAGTMGKWFGLSDGQLDTIFPNLRNFAARDLNFMTPLTT
jgi:uncharacterized protein (DUF1501 family)